MKSIESLAVVGKPTSTSSLVVQTPESLLQQLAGLQHDLREQVVKSAKDGESFDSTERMVWDMIRKMGYAALELFIAAQGSGDLGEQVVTGEQRELARSEQPTLTTLRSIFGTHSFKQFTYSAGAHRKIELRPISTRMQLPENAWSYLLQEFSQLFCCDQAFNQAAKSLGTVFGAKFSVDTLEQTTARMGPQAHAFLDKLPTPAAKTESKILVASADGKGVPLLKENPDPVAAFQGARKRPGNRRMATVASVYTVDPYERTAEQIVQALFREVEEDTDKPKRPQPTNKHTMAHLPTVFVDDDVEVPISGIFEGMSWLGLQVDERHRENQPCVLLMDGQQALWDAARVCIGVPVIAEVLDIIHVSSYVWEAAGLFEESEVERKAFTRERLLKILNGEVSGVIRGLRRMGSTAKFTGDKLKDLQRICGYFENNQSRMCYDQYLAAGYPIASGVIEGACAHLVKDRMERSGMRWTLEGARSMLDVRAIFQSSYWDAFCQQRIIELNETLHPHLELLSEYESLAVAC